MTDTERRFLAELCGECWHEKGDDEVTYFDPFCIHCGMPMSEEWKPRTFTTPDDLELLMQKVVRPSIEGFSKYTMDIWLEDAEVDFPFWWLLKTPTEQIALILGWAKTEYPDVWEKMKGESQ